MRTRLSECAKIKSIIIPDSVKRIGYGAFYGCESLETITIGINVEKMNRSAFHDCPSLKTINYKGTQEQWDAIKIEDSWSGMPAVTINCNYQE